MQMWRGPIATPSASILRSLTAASQGEAQAVWVWVWRWW